MEKQSNEEERETVNKYQSVSSNNLEPRSDITERSSVVLFSGGNPGKLSHVQLVVFASGLQQGFVAALLYNAALLSSGQARW